MKAFEARNLAESLRKRQIRQESGPQRVAMFYIIPAPVFSPPAEKVNPRCKSVTGTLRHARVTPENGQVAKRR